MRWENVRFLGESGAVIVSRGKTNSARRAVPMTPRVRDILEARWQVAGFGQLRARKTDTSCLIQSMNYIVRRSRTAAFARLFFILCGTRF